MTLQGIANHIDNLINLVKSETISDQFLLELENLKTQVQKLHGHDPLKNQVLLPLSLDSSIALKRLLEDEETFGNRYLDNIYQQLESITSIELSMEEWLELFEPTLSLSEDEDNRNIWVLEPDNQIINYYSASNPRYGTKFKSKRAVQRGITISIEVSKEKLFQIFPEVTE